MNIRSIALIISALALCTSAMAQHVWVDENGKKHYSDTPPPTNTPKNRIIQAKDMPTPSESKPIEAAKPASLSARNEDFNKRRTEQAEKDKKAADEQQAAEDKKQNCARARDYQKALDSGVRMAHTDSKGERNYLSDAQREKEKADVKKALTGC